MNENTDSKKILITLPNEVLSIFDDLAKRNGMSRSAMINYALRWYLDYKESSDVLLQLLNIIQNTNKEEINRLQENYKKTD